jgi:hypothetical protein
MPSLFFILNSILLVGRNHLLNSPDLHDFPVKSFLWLLEIVLAPVPQHRHYENNALHYDQKYNLLVHLGIHSGNDISVAVFLNQHQLGRTLSSMLVHFSHSFLELWCCILH